MFSAAVLEHSQTTGHGADGGSTAHDVFTEAHVDVSNGEEDENVHERVVRGAHGLTVAKEYKHPLKPGIPTGTGTPSLSIERKAGNDDHEAAQSEHEEHGALSKRIMTGILRSSLAEEEVVLDLLKEHLPPLQPPKRRYENHA